MSSHLLASASELIHQNPSSESPILRPIPPVRQSIHAPPLYPRSLSKLQDIKDRHHSVHRTVLGLFMSLFHQHHSRQSSQMLTIIPGKVQLWYHRTISKGVRTKGDKAHPPILCNAFLVSSVITPARNLYSIVISIVFITLEIPAPHPPNCSYLPDLVQKLQLQFRSNSASSLTNSVLLSSPRHSCSSPQLYSPLRMGKMKRRSS
jgi:hypothetical protein